MTFCLFFVGRFIANSTTCTDWSQCQSVLMCSVFSQHLHFQLCFLVHHRTRWTHWSMANGTLFKKFRDKVQMCIKEQLLFIISVLQKVNGTHSHRKRHHYKGSKKVPWTSSHQHLSEWPTAFIVHFKFY